jgi:hypothetical protein
MVLTVNGGYFLKQHLPVDFCNGKVRVLFEVRTEFLVFIRFSALNCLLA